MRGWLVLVALGMSACGAHRPAVPVPSVVTAIADAANPDVCEVAANVYLFP